MTNTNLTENIYTFLKPCHSDRGRNMEVEHVKPKKSLKQV